MDKEVMPNIPHEVKNKDFTLRIMAYKKLSEAELRAVAYGWLRASGKKKFPTKGTVTFYYTAPVNW